MFKTDLGVALKFYSKIKYGTILEHKISWKVLNIFPPECSNDLGLTLTFLNRVKFDFWAFILETFMDFVEDFGV